MIWGHTKEYSVHTPAPHSGITPGPARGTRDGARVGCMQGECPTHCTISLATKRHIFKEAYFPTIPIMGFVFSISKLFVVSLPSTGGIKAKTFLRTSQIRAVGRLYAFNVLTLFPLLHRKLLSLQPQCVCRQIAQFFQYLNTLKKLPRNLCVDQEKQFGVISIFHHFLLESLKH